jgi:hypothetical protein
MKAKLWKETENRLELTIEGLESQISAAMIKVSNILIRYQPYVVKKAPAFRL